MSNSGLISLTKLSSFKSSRYGNKITKITPHHMAGNLSIEACGDEFQKPGKDASSNYGIGTDGRIGLYVDESERSWASSSAWNDRQAVTIEVADMQRGEPWPISDAAWNSLVALCVDICIRNNIPGLSWTGDPSGSLTCHYMFTSTSCPGTTLKGRMAELANEVNTKLNNGWIPTLNGLSSSVVWGDLYATENTKEDAILREVAYEDDNHLTVTRTRDAISVVNYTDVMSELWNWGKVLLAPAYDLDGISGNARVIIDCLIQKGLNAAAACGVAGNIQAESSFKPDALGDYQNGVATSFGLCQWHYGRGDAMKNFVGADWNTNISGQIDYLWHEINYTNEKDILPYLQNCTDNEEGCKYAADKFVRIFERPKYPDTESPKRQEYALNLYRSIGQCIRVDHPVYSQ